MAVERVQQLQVTAGQHLPHPRGAVLRRRRQVPPVVRKLNVPHLVRVVLHEPLEPQNRTKTEEYQRRLTRCVVQYMRQWGKRGAERELLEPGRLHKRIALAKCWVS
eukprot:1187098-Prorocentrum_minimum.AAC.6